MMGRCFFMKKLWFRKGSKEEKEMKEASSSVREDQVEEKQLSQLSEHESYNTPPNSSGSTPVSSISSHTPLNNSGNTPARLGDVEILEAEEASSPAKIERKNSFRNLLGKSGRTASSPSAFKTVPRTKLPQTDKSQHRHPGDIDTPPTMSTNTQPRTPKLQYSQSEIFPSNRTTTEEVGDVETVEKSKSEYDKSPAKRNSFRSASMTLSRTWGKKDSGGASVTSKDSKRLRRVSTVTYMRRSVIAKKSKSIRDPSKLIRSTNPNKLGDYVWTAEVVRAVDSATDACGSFPLFLVFGACPNSFTNMQAVMYVYKNKKVDYWWIKPTREDASKLERETLVYNTSGTWKNDPGKSKTVYDPVMHLFDQGGRHGDLSFELVHDTRARACINVHGEKDVIKERLYIYLIWQEDWTVNPFSRSRFLKGKVVFKYEPKDIHFCAREFLLRDNLFKLVGEDSNEFTDIFTDGASEVKDIYEN